MQLQHRIKILEQELEILKNQIQKSLLDIQEQLLANTYPALRAEPSPVGVLPTASSHAPSHGSNGYATLADPLEEWLEEAVDRVGTRRVERVIEMTLGNDVTHQTAQRKLRSWLAAFPAVDSAERGNVSDLTELMSSLMVVLNQD